MISRVKGKIIDKKENSVLIDVNGICYEILIPVSIIDSIEFLSSEDGLVELVTYYYHQLESMNN